MGYNFADSQQLDSVLAPYGSGAEITIAGRIVNCLFSRPETGFCLLDIETVGYRRFRAAGIFAAPVSINHYYVFVGRVAERDGKWQLEVKSYKRTLPVDPDGIVTVLQTLAGLDTQAHQVYKKLGREALRLIHDNPEEVVNRLKGVSMSRALAWQKQLSATDAAEESLTILAEMGLSAQKAKAVLDKFGPSVGEMIKADPYFLASKEGFLSFRECDRIALANGIDMASPYRISAAMVYVLKIAAFSYGDCYLPENEFLARTRSATGLQLKIKEARALIQSHGSHGMYRWNQNGVTCEVDLGKLSEAIRSCSPSGEKAFRFSVYTVPDKALFEALSSATSNGSIVREEAEDTSIYLHDSVYQAERSVAASIRNIQNANLPFDTENKPIIERFCTSKGLQLETQQHYAVETFTRTRGGFYVLNGIAGGGKTFTLNVVLRVLETIYSQSNEAFSAVILAPTGKAAKVAASATGMPTSTIHKALGLVGSDEDESKLRKIDAKCVIIDESSMVDIFLAKKLFRSIPATTKVIVVGDTNQLPSIGCGAVLRDIISSGKVDVATLTVSRRQSSSSGILKNATKILAGERITTETPEGTDRNASYVVNRKNDLACRAAVIETVRHQIHDLGRSISDVQVLCPMRKGDVGADTLNLFIQRELLPLAGEGERAPAREVTYEMNGDIATDILYFVKGDKVIHVENNYDMQWYRLQRDGNLVIDEARKGIVNGEMGIVQRVMASESNGYKTYKVLVRYDDGYVLYKDNLSQLQHAYAMTIHKSQGSQWPVVVSAITNSSYSMLARNLMYTMMSRAQETSYVYGQASALARAVENNEQLNRNTRLASRI